LAVAGSKGASVPFLHTLDEGLQLRRNGVLAHQGVLLPVNHYPPAHERVLVGHNTRKGRPSRPHGRHPPLRSAGLVNSSLDFFSCSMATILLAAPSTFASTNPDGVMTTVPLAWGNAYSAIPLDQPLHGFVHYLLWLVYGIARPS